MNFAAAISEHPDVRQAAGEVIGEIIERLGTEPHLAAVFVTSTHGDAVAEIARAVRTLLRPEVLIGAAAASVVGGDREVEEEPAVVLWAGRLGAPVTPLRLEAISGPDGWAFPGLPAGTMAEPAGRGDRHVILVADPFSFPSDAFVEMAAARLPSWRVIGGLASAAGRPGGNRLVLDGEVHTDGAVGVLLPPGAGAATVVSQGCRPVGEPMVVTRAQHNVVFELAGKPALERLAEVVNGLSIEERDLARRGLHVGWVIDEHKARFEQGDFLIRNVLGGNKEVGAIVVSDRIEVGTTLQFQIRDADSADDDLRHLLAGRQASAVHLYRAGYPDVRSTGS